MLQVDQLHSPWSPPERSSATSLCPSTGRYPPPHGIFTNGERLGGPIKNLYDFVEKNGTAPDIKTRLDVLAITPTTAVVRIDMEKDAIGADYNDFLTLIKLDGGWKSPRSITSSRGKRPIDSDLLPRTGGAGPTSEVTPIRPPCLTVLPAGGYMISGWRE